MTMSIFLIYSPALCWGLQQQCNHEICTTALFFITKDGRAKDIVSGLVQQVVGDMSPPVALKLGFC